jgi:hypothetical protein
MGRRLAAPEKDAIAKLQRITFSTLATLRQHQALATTLRRSPAVSQLLTYRDAEDD